MVATSINNSHRASNCTPGNSLQSQMVATSINNSHRASNCTPGNRLQSLMIANSISSHWASNCTPGNSLQSLMVATSISSHQESNCTPGSLQCVMVATWSSLQPAEYILVKPFVRNGCGDDWTESSTKPTHSFQDNWYQTKFHPSSLPLTVHSQLSHNLILYLFLSIHNSLRTSFSTSILSSHNPLRTSFSTSFYPLTTLSEPHSLPLSILSQISQNLILYLKTILSQLSQNLILYLFLSSHNSLRTAFSI